MARFLQCLAEVQTACNHATEVHEAAAEPASAVPGVGVVALDQGGHVQSLAILHDKNVLILDHLAVQQDPGLAAFLQVPVQDGADQNGPVTEQVVVVVVATVPATAVVVSTAAVVSVFLSMTPLA